MGMNIATKAALTALSGIKIGGGYAVKGVGKGVGYIGFGLKWTGDKIEKGGDAMAQFGSEMVDSGMLAWKIAGGQLSEEELQAIIDEDKQKKEAMDAEVVDDNKAGLDNLKEAAKKAAETAMEAVAQVIETVQTKTEEKTAPAAQTTTAQKSETEMSPAEMAEAFC